MSQFRWVCICPTVLGGVPHKVGDIWTGEGQSPVGSPSWSMVPCGEQPVSPEPEGPRQLQPVADWSSD